jgi:cytochrome c peroxidase
MQSKVLGSWMSVFARRLRSIAPVAVVLGALPWAIAPLTAHAADQAPFTPLPGPMKVNEARARLGAVLFFDNRLSGDTGNSCATCHNPAKGWSDGQPLSAGYTGVDYFRRSPSLFDVAYRRYLMWDARLDGADLDTAVRDMITDAHTMNADTRLVQERLKQVPEYVKMFEDAFGPGDPYGGKIYGAVAEFLKTIRTQNAPFDKYLRGDKKALTEQQLDGMKLFAGSANCIACHYGPTLSDGKVHALGVPDNPELATNAGREISMLRFYAVMGTPNYMNLRTDVGNYVVTKDNMDIGKFLTPSLWDVGQRGPYMHSGVFRTLDEVVDFYDRGGGDGLNKDALLKPLRLTASEKKALVAFLQSLTGDGPKVEAPKTFDYQIRELGKN